MLRALPNELAIVEDIDREKKVQEEREEIPNKMGEERSHEMVLQRKQKRTPTTSAPTRISKRKSNQNDDVGPSEKNATFAGEDAYDDDFVTPNAKMKTISKRDVDSAKKKINLGQIVLHAQRRVGKRINRTVYDNISSRHSPHLIVRLCKDLSKKRRQAIVNMGFGALLDCCIDYVPTKLGYWVVDNFNPEKMTIEVGNFKEKLTKKKVHEILGFPMGKIAVKAVKRLGAADTELIKKWRRQYPCTSKGTQFISVRNVYEKIMEDEKCDELFRLNALLLFMTLMAEGIKCGTINQRILPAINDISDIPNMDWCEYVMDCVKRCKETWNRNEKGSWFTGPLLLLVLWYASSVKKDTALLKKKKHQITWWSNDMLREVENNISDWKTIITQVAEVKPKVLEKANKNDQEKMKDKDRASLVPTDVRRLPKKGVGKKKVEGKRRLDLVKGSLIIGDESDDEGSKELKQKKKEKEFVKSAGVKLLF